jgi:subtilase family serine protease
MKQLRRVVLPLLVVALLFCSLPIFSQGPAPRLERAITEADRVVLSNSRTPRVHAAQDLGAVSPDTAVPGITLVFRRSSAQEAALKELLAAQQNTTSPLYHHWLTPETFAARFGVADEDIATTESWLAARGFHVESVARSRDRITFSGTAAQVQAAFGAELHHYRADGESHFAPASDLTLPAEIASVTTAVLHLSDFRPKPNVRRITGTQPNYTAMSTQAHYLSPGDIEKMYDLNPLLGSGFDANGQELAVVGQSYVDTSGDLERLRVSEIFWRD